MKVRNLLGNLLITAATALNLSFAMENDKNYPEDVNLFLNAKPHFETPRLAKMFENVTFHPPFVFVKNTTQYKTEGDLFVHFSDASQIEQTLEKGINLSAKGTIYYIQDLKSREPIQYTSDQNLEVLQAIYIDGARGLKLMGSFEYSKAALILPRNFDIKECNVRGHQTLFGNLNDLQERKQLIKILKKFDKDLFHTRTKEAQSLMEIVERNSSRPLQQKALVSDRNPNLYLLSTALVEEDIIDQITVKKPLAAVGKSIEDIKTLKASYSLNHHFNLVLPHIEQSGFYSIKPFYLQEMHTIKCAADLLILGTLNLPKASLLIKTTRNLWAMGAQIKCGGSIEICSDSLCITSLSQQEIIQASQKLPKPLFIKLLKTLSIMNYRF